MKVAIIGSRNFPTPLESLERMMPALPPDTVIISGGARGIDRAAETWAHRRGLEVWVKRADWSGTRGKMAGKDRNWDIVREADEVIAFWDGESNGTAHSVAAAVRFGKPVTIWMPGDS